MNDQSSTWTQMTFAGFAKSYPLAQGGRDARRAQRLRGYGNAINPHAAAEFIRAFAQVFREATHG